MNPVVKNLGVTDYVETWRQMQRFTDLRDAASVDELWVLQHPPVFTLGQAGKEEHLLNVGKIPVVQCDRGGQVTYHGPGQIIIYTLLDIRRAKIGIRELVIRLEQAIIITLGGYGVESSGRRDAPGVYVDGKKIAALGLRVRRGCTFHGLALNADMDLAPFSLINPCGFQGLEVTSAAKVGINADTTELTTALLESLQTQLTT